LITDDLIKGFEIIAISKCSNTVYNKKASNVNSSKNKNSGNYFLQEDFNNRILKEHCH